MKPTVIVTFDPVLNEEYQQNLTDLITMQMGEVVNVP